MGIQDIYQETVTMDLEIRDFLTQEGEEGEEGGIIPEFFMSPDDLIVVIFNQNAVLPIYMKD